MTLQQLLSPARRAIDEYHMIGDGDRVAVGLSGGKDSVALLAGMANLRRFYPEKFDIDIWSELSDTCEDSIRVVSGSKIFINVKIKNKEDSLLSIYKIFEKYLEIMKRNAKT